MIFGFVNRERMGASFPTSMNTTPSLGAFSSMDLVYPGSRRSNRITSAPVGISAPKLGWMMRWHVKSMNSSLNFARWNSFIGWFSRVFPPATPVRDESACRSGCKLQDHNDERSRLSCNPETQPRDSIDIADTIPKPSRKSSPKPRPLDIGLVRFPPIPVRGGSGIPPAIPRL